MKDIYLMLEIPFYILFVLFYWHNAYHLCKKYQIINSFTEFLITKNMQSNKFIWGIVFSRISHKIERTFEFYVVKFGIWFPVILFIIHIAII